MNEETAILEFDYMGDKTTLGDRIEAARSAKHMSKAELAERLGVKKSTIRKWENDQSEPRSNRLYMMAGILDCNVMWLLNGEGDVPEQGKSSPQFDNIEDIKSELNVLLRSAEDLTAQIKALEAKL